MFSFVSFCNFHLSLATHSVAAQPLSCRPAQLKLLRCVLSMECLCMSSIRWEWELKMKSILYSGLTFFLEILCFFCKRNCSISVSYCSVCAKVLHGDCYRMDTVLQELDCCLVLSVSFLVHDLFLHHAPYRMSYVKPWLYSECAAMMTINCQQWNSALRVCVRMGTVLHHTERLHSLVLHCVWPIGADMR